MPHDALQAIEKIERTLAIAGRPMTISKIAKKSGLHYTTVKRYVNLLESVKKMPEISVVKGEGATLVSLETARNMAELPEEEQIKVIKSYFPSLDSEGKFLVGLMDRNAIKQTVAVGLRKSPLVRKMLKLHRIAETADRKFYLTDLGCKIAKGAKKIYG